jgi:hypothetical protein
MTELYGFCTNSRRWLIRMDLKGEYPQTCPYDPTNCADDDNCGYYTEREPTPYLLRYLKDIGVRE